MSAPSISRRELLALLGGASFAAGCGLDLDIPDDATFDEVLAALHRTRANFSGGLSNHGPMAIEALVQLGLEDQVVPFIQGYDDRLDEREDADALPEADREDALGDESQLEPWIVAYEGETLSPQELIDRDWGWLAPGLVGAGLHGILRVAHALRSLERLDTPTRRTELAHGLGYFAASYSSLPGTPGAQPEAGLELVSALRQVPAVPASDRVTSGLIMDRLDPVRSLAGFPEAIAAIDLSTVDVPDAIGQLCAAAARMFMTAGDIVTLHCVTGTSALRLVLPWLDDAQQRNALGYSFQALAALRSATGIDPGEPRSFSSEGSTEADVADLAAGSLREHTIKFAEVALREYALDPQPELLAAAIAWGG